MVSWSWILSLWELLQNSPNFDWHTQMRSVIYIRYLLSEICSKFNLAFGARISTISTVFENNWADKILVTTDPPHLSPRFDTTGFIHTLTAIHDDDSQPKAPLIRVWRHQRQVMHARPTYIISTKIWRTTSKLGREIGLYNKTIGKISYWRQSSDVLQYTILKSTFWEDTFFFWSNSITCYLDCFTLWLQTSSIQNAYKFLCFCHPWGCPW